MRNTLLTIAALVLLGAAAVWGYTTYGPQTNPDPNHTHADFAVWINGKQLDFSDARYMTTEAEEEAAPAGSPKKYFHMHDGDGDVIHRHKPGLTLGDFFESIMLPMDGQCITLDDHQFAALDPGWVQSYSITKRLCTNGKFHWNMYVNGAGMPFNPGYVFNDADQILLTYDAADDHSGQLKQLTDDACKYSKTCPWKGAPPTENCIADPTVPCSI